LQAVDMLVAGIATEIAGALHLHQARAGGFANPAEKIFALNANQNQEPPPHQPPLRLLLGPMLWLCRTRHSAGVFVQARQQDGLAAWHEGAEQSAK
jgi:hypothetical protein